MLKRVISVVAGAGTITLGVLPATAADAATARGKLTVCNHSGYLYGVYADGPSFRVTDLGSWDECVYWKPRSGYYEIGYDPFSSIGTSQTVRIKRNAATIYKMIGGDFVFHTFVAKGRTTRVDLGIPELP